MRESIRLPAMVRLVRPSQWVKNLVVFAAVVFAQRLFDPTAITRSLLAFAAFCALASATYVVNDLFDRETDRNHPEKAARPIPSGEVGVGAAWGLAGALYATGLGLAWLLGPSFVLVAGGYVGLQILYSWVFKHWAIVDVLSIAIGFVLRATAGGVAIGVEVSPWLVICTFLLATFLGLAKRRHEILLLESHAGEHRPALLDYDPYVIDQMIAVVTASTVVAYAIYTVSPEVRDKLGTDKLYLTLPFVLFGIFRYLFLIHQRAEGGNPTKLLLTDRPLLGNVVLWVGTAVALLYG